jgi:hypothetical protein
MNYLIIQLFTCLTIRAKRGEFKIQQSGIIKLLVNHFRILVSASLISVFGFQASAYAANEGDMMYNKDHHVLQFFDGTNWIAMGKAWTGTDGGGCTGPPSGSAGNVIYNYAYCVPQYCDSVTWKPVGHPRARAGACP